MITLKQALQKLVDAGVPIRYPTLYTWARRGIMIGDVPHQFASKVGNNWVADSAKVQEIIDAVRNQQHIQVQPADPHAPKSTTETRGRKPGTKFGSYRKRDKTDPHGVFPT